MASPVNLAQPFRFLDLPTEIRFQIYDGLRDRELNLKFSRLDFCKQVGAAACLSGCFYPELLRTNKQISTEYSAMATGRLCLVVNATVGAGIYDDTEWHKNRTLPDEVLARIVAVHITYRVVNYWPRIDSFFGMFGLLHAMPGLEGMVFHAIVNLDNLTESEMHAHYQYYEFGQMLTTIHEMINDYEGSTGVRFRGWSEIRCPEYLALEEEVSSTTSDEEGNGQEEHCTKEAIWAIVDDPRDPDYLHTVDLHGLRVVFKGIGDRGISPITHRMGRS